MQPKIKYRDTEFELLENNIEIAEAAGPLRIYYRKLKAEYIDDIDTTPLDYYENKLEDYEETIKQLKLLDPNEIYHGEQTNAQKIEEVNLKIEELNKNLAEDKNCQIILKLKEDVEQEIFAMLVLKVDLMKNLFSKILIGDISKIDYKDLESYKVFAVEVLAHFFHNLQRSKN